MISIVRATEKDYESIVSIGKITVTEAHTGSCADEILREYIDAHYNREAITAELADPANIYHLIHYHNEPVGFSKIVLNAPLTHPERSNTTKLDRIYVLSRYQGVRLGYELLQYNIAYCKQNGQTGLWLYTWVGNQKAIQFYTRAGFEVIGSHLFHVSREQYNLNHHMFLDFQKTEQSS